MDHNPDAHLAAFQLTPRHRLGVHLHPHQDEAHHLGARHCGDQHRRRLGRLCPGAGHAQRVRLMTADIGEARIRVPDRVPARRADHGAMPSSPIRWTPGSSATPTASPFPRTSSRTWWSPTATGNRPVHLDLRHQPRSDRQLHPQGRPRSAPDHGMDRQQGRRVQTVGRHQVRLRLILRSSSGAGPPLAPVARRFRRDASRLEARARRLCRHGRHRPRGRGPAQRGVRRDVRRCGRDRCAGQPPRRPSSCSAPSDGSPTARSHGWCSPTIIPTITSAPIVLRKAGAKVIAHPDRRALASEAGRTR